MPLSEFNKHIVQTLAYYEIFDHPLTAHELFFLFPKNSLSQSEFTASLNSSVSDQTIVHSAGYYKLSGNTKDVIKIRTEREKLATSRMKIAKFMARIIKQFPFVRGIFLSGDLSKGVAYPESDLDFVIVTSPGRLWICRSFLVLFKKLFLLNSKKFFCLNYYVTSDTLQLEDHNYYTATEIAHLKPLYNIKIFIQYMNANAWIKSYFPNFRTFALSDNEAAGSRSFLQPVFEVIFSGKWAARLDRRLMNYMKHVWAKRYPQYDATTQEKIFRCTPNESCAYVGNFSDKILSLYRDKLTSYHLS